jgi:hypothetical protein
MRNLKGSQFLLRFVTAEREAIPNAARKHTATVTGKRKKTLQTDKVDEKRLF